MSVSPFSWRQPCAIHNSWAGTPDSVTTTFLPPSFHLRPATDYRICQGLDKPKLKHPHHATFHKTVVSKEDEEKGVTRFYRW